MRRAAPEAHARASTPFGRPIVLASRPTPPAFEPQPPRADPWARLAADLRHPDVELDVETFAGVWSAYLAEKRRGRPIDPVLSALLTILSRQALRLDDGVEDTCDAAPPTGRAA